MNGETSGKKTPQRPSDRSNRPSGCNTKRHSIKPRHGAVMLLTAAIIAVAAVVMASVRACHAHEDAPQPQPKALADSTIIHAIQSHSRLYTAETTARKTVRYSAHNAVHIDAAGIKKDISLPLSKTEMEIPVLVTYKAFIDLERIRHGDITTKGDSIIHITLPDPVITETAVAIDHDNASYKRQMLGRKMSQDEINALVARAREDAWRDLPDTDRDAMVETAKISATETLMPQLRRMGFKYITIDYRQNFIVLHD